MNYPKVKNFKNQKGFQAQAEVGVNSPYQNNNQNINVILQPSPSENSLTKDREFRIVSNPKVIKKNVILQTEDSKLELDENALSDSVEENFKQRTLESAKENLEEIDNILKNKDNLIEALSLILDIYETNPLLINKCIVAKEDELSRLLFLLTEAHEIELIKYDRETDCCGNQNKFIRISKIMIKKNGNNYNFKYSFPNVINLLEKRRIAWKFVY